MFLVFCPNVHLQQSNHWLWAGSCVILSRLTADCTLHISFNCVPSTVSGTVAQRRRVTTYFSTARKRVDSAWWSPCNLIVKCTISRGQKCNIQASKVMNVIQSICFYPLVRRGNIMNGVHDDEKVFAEAPWLESSVGSLCLPHILVLLLLAKK